MRHPDEGTLRRLLDEPDGVADDDREHVATCRLCRTETTTIKEDAMLAEKVLSVQTDTDPDRAWQRLTAPKKKRFTAPLAAVVAVAAILGGAGAAAATDWLPIFAAERVAPVTAPRADLIGLPDLDDFGALEVTQKVDVRPVADAAQAEKVAGLPVPRVATLPRGVTGEPTYRAGAQASATFTFDAAKVGRADVPPGLDGARFRFVAGPGVVAMWQKKLVVGRAVAPVVYSADVPFATARDYVLSLPNVPPGVAAQLRAFSGDGSTLPLFVQDERFTTGAADVNGVRATVLTSRDGAVSGAVWVDRGIVTVVAGSLRADEVLSVARHIRGDR